MPGKAAALQHRPRGSARCGEIEQQHAQAGVGNFARDQHGGAAASSPSGETKMARAAPAAISFSAAFSMSISPSVERAGTTSLRRRIRQLVAAITSACDVRARVPQPLRGSSGRLAGRHLHLLAPDRRVRRRPDAWHARRTVPEKRHDRHQQQRADEGSADDRHDLREIGLGRHDGAREDARVDRQIVAVLARRRLAVAGQVGFQQVRAGPFASRSSASQFDLLFAGARRCGLQRVEVGDELILAELRGLRLRRSGP